VIVNTQEHAGRRTSRHTNLIFLQSLIDVVTLRYEVNLFTEVSPWNQWLH